MTLLELIKEKVLYALAALFCASALLIGCGSGSTGASTMPPPPQVITVQAVSGPVPAGSQGLQGIVDGTGFTATSIVLWNGSALATSYQTDQILYTTVPTSLLTPGTASIQVKDTGTNAISNTMTFAILSPAAVGATVLQLVTVGLDGSPANGDSQVSPSISATGRFLAFNSAATNLVAIPVTGYSNIYLRDTCVGAATACTPSTQLVSVSADGTTGANFQTYDSTVSQDGRYVVFDSLATNLLADDPSYCAGTDDCLFLRDTCIGASGACTPKTTLASILPGEIANGGGLPVITPSGRYLTFDSNALTPGNDQTYLRDLCVGASSGCVPSTIAISVNSSGAYGNLGANPQSLSGNGRFVGFVSYSDNLAQPSVPDSAMMFVRDTCIGATTSCVAGVSRVDVANDGSGANNELDFEAIPSLSNDGRYIAYSSDATNLVSQDVHGFGNVYERDTCAGATSRTAQTILVSLGNDQSIANSGSHQQSMSTDGRFVAFTSISTNLVWNVGYPAGSFQDVYVRDTCIGAPVGCGPSTVRVAVNNTPSLQFPSDNGASEPAISADGHYAIYVSTSTNLIAGAGNGHTQVFLSKTGF